MKYKLVKEYPGSPKLGTILTHEELQYCNWNEYYQEVVEKDYEILSLVHKKQNRILLAKDANIDIFLECKLDYNYWSIHSIKRLSDLQIFTIGDRLDEKCFRKLSRHPLSEGIHDNIITKIAIVKKHASEVAGHLEIQNGKLMFSASNKWNNLNVLLSEAIKYKQPLFTTEDGVDIFEGDRFWNTRLLELTEIQVTNKKYSLLFLTDGSKSFSTKEKAEEYILKHKPCLSLEDLKELGIFNETEYCNRMWISIKELVQQKLNK